MRPEHFCIDEFSFNGLLDNSTNIVTDICMLIEVAEEILSQGHSIFVSDNIEFVKISSDLSFFDLYSVDFSQSDIFRNLDRDTLERFLALKRRLDTLSTPNQVLASIFDPARGCTRSGFHSGAAEIIHHEKNAGGECFALVVVGINETAGEHDLHINGIFSSKIFMLRSKIDLTPYARWLIQEFGNSADDFFALWDRAFPSLLRSCDLTFNRFTGKYNALSNYVLKHLVFLNDHYQRLFDECNNDFVCIKRKAKSIYDIDFSNESVKTRNSKSKMKKRTATFSNGEVVCELHTKICHNKNRIHFHPPIPNIGGDKILIGIFVDHLET